MSSTYTHWRRQQRGASLLELMVGISIGLLVSLAAISTVVLTRTSGNTVADSSLMISQGNNAIRMLSFHIRQAGALEIAAVNPALPLAERQYTFSDLYSTITAADTAVQGTEGGGVNPDQLVVSYQNRGGAVTRDCLGANVDATATPARVQNTFRVVGTNLMCLGSGNAQEQPVAENVEDFQVFYWVQTGTGATATQIRRTADQVIAAGGWNSAVAVVVAVEVCLQLRGEQTGHPIVAGSTFANCQGATTAQDGRMHQMFRNTFYMRNQGDLL